MAVGDKILTIDYNSVQTKLQNLLGNGSGSFGWGQTVKSSQVTQSNKVSVNEWGNLRNDILSSFRHILESEPTVVGTAVAQKIRYNDDGVLPEDADSPIIQYDRWADQLASNRFLLPESQSRITNQGFQTRTWPNAQQAFWNNRLSIEVTVSFTAANQARYFFNSGGEVRFRSTRTGETVSQQNNAWTNLLASAGFVLFGAQLPQPDFSPMNGTNFYKLTSTYQVSYSVSASSPYTQNRYQISARTPGVANNSQGTANQIQFLVEYIDGYQDPGPPLPGDRVDGTLTLEMSTREADGILIPVGSGEFSVETPSVTIGEFVQTANNAEFI